MANVFKVVGGFFLDIIETVVISLSVFLIVYLFIMQPHQVNGQSMYPTYHNGEYLLTNKLLYKTNTPKRGDVVVFHAPDRAQCPEGTGCDFIKRVIGLPGDTVAVQNGKIYVNGDALTESYLSGEVNTKAGNFTINGPITVPTGSYFVVGDNRDHSSDSRAWGPVELEKIVGKVFFRYWPAGRVGVITDVAY